MPPLAPSMTSSARCGSYDSDKTWTAPVGQPTGAVHVLSESYDPHLADEVMLGASGGIEVCDQQLDGVRPAVDGRDPRHVASSTLTQGPAAQNSPSRSSTSSPSGFTPRPCARDWPASTCRHLTRVGIPPADTPAISGTCPIDSRNTR